MRCLHTQSSTVHKTYGEQLSGASPCLNIWYALITPLGLDTRLNDMMPSMVGMQATVRPNHENHSPFTHENSLLSISRIPRLLVMLQSFLSPASRLHPVGVCLRPGLGSGCNLMCTTSQCQHCCISSSLLCAQWTGHTLWHLLSQPKPNDLYAFLVGVYTMWGLGFGAHSLYKSAMTAAASHSTLVSAVRLVRRCLGLAFIIIMGIFILPLMTGLLLELTILPIRYCT